MYLFVVYVCACSNFSSSLMSSTVWYVATRTGRTYERPNKATVLAAQPHESSLRTPGAARHKCTSVGEPVPSDDHWIHCIVRESTLGGLAVSYLATILWLAIIGKQIIPLYLIYLHGYITPSIYYIYMHVHICVYVYINLYLHSYLCVYSYISIYVLIYILACIHIFNPYAQSPLQAILRPTFTFHSPSPLAIAVPFASSLSLLTVLLFYYYLLLLFYFLFFND